MNMQQNNRTFRLAGNPAQKEATLRLLADQGFTFGAHDFYPDAFELKSGPLPLGSSLAARFGLIYIQDASSMLPPLALLHLLRSGELDNLHEADKLTVQYRSASETRPANRQRINVLDMCSSPGGKSSLIARELERHWPGRGFVLANEPGVKRLATLRRNLRDMNLFNCGSSGFEGQSLPLPAAGWDCIILDPPCSGWGTVEKNPQVMELWQGDKVKPLIGLQQLLLTEALRLLRPGGLLVYSTCTVNVQENEEQVLWATETLGGCTGLPLPHFAGFTFAEPLLGCNGCLRVPLGSALGQGFFIAALCKEFRADEGQTLAAGEGPRKEQRTNRSGQPELDELPLSAISSPLCSPELLPPGRLFCNRGNLIFYPEGGLELLGLTGNFLWNGFPLGRSLGAGLKPRTETHLRGLIPDPETAAQNGAAVLNLEEISPALALLSGQSLNLNGLHGLVNFGGNSSGAAEAGLYYRDLPLCRLKMRGGRVFI
ncbi:MAG: RsmB/NOP family class I SAM-dependent RNA methyltransferase [Deltaproteobacteria bacterium]|jgi:16S rRNA (cytosine1407-C5)-methyltransferase|nr:RsmB/NOP family class I SAM-dependent RNA methyltransferase [Deltaproteobacteria bacterium]